MKFMAKIFLFATSVAAISLASAQTYTPPTQNVYYWEGAANNTTINNDCKWYLYDGTDYVLKTWAEVNTAMTNGSAKFDRLPGDTATGQYNLNSLNLSVDTLYNYNAATWHWYFNSTTGQTFTAKFVDQNSDGILRFRTSGSAKDAVFKVTDTIKIQKGTFQIGTQVNGNQTDNFAVRDAEFNIIEISKGTYSTLALSKLFTAKTINVGATDSKSTVTRLYVINGTETNTTYSDALEAKVDVMNIEQNGGFAAYFGLTSKALQTVIIKEINVKTSEAKGDNCGINIYSKDFVAGTIDPEDPYKGAQGAKIGAINLTESGALDLVFGGTMTTALVGNVTINSTNPLAVTPYLGFAGGNISTYKIEKLDFKSATSGTVNLAFKNSADAVIDAMKIYSTTTADSTLRLTASTSKNVEITNITNEAGSKGGLTLNGDTNATSLSSKNITIIGDTVNAANTVFNVKVATAVSDLSSLTVTEKFSLTGKATSTMGNGTGVRLKNVSFKDAEISDGSISTIFTAGMSQTGTVTVKGAGSQAVWYVGANSDAITHGSFGTINVSDQGLWYLRRSMNNPNYTINTLNISSTAAEYTNSRVYIGASVGYESGSVSITNLNILASSATPTVNDLGSASMAFYLVNGAVGSETAKITTLTSSAYSNGYLDFRCNASIGSITTNEASNLTIMTGLSPTAYKATVTGDFNSNSNSINLSKESNLHVKGDFYNSRMYNSNLNGLALNLNAAEGKGVGSFTVDGTFYNNGIFFINGGSGASDVSISVGGFTNTISNAGYRITSSGDYTGGQATAVLTGTGNYIFSERIHDYKQTESDVSTLTGKVAITKNGTGKQFFTGNNYYRGATTINAGELYMRADGTANNLGRGIGAIILKGGKFGAVGSANSTTFKALSAGKVIADSMSWSNLAEVVVFVDATSNSLLDITGALAKGAGDTLGRKYNFSFEFLNDLATPESEYKIMTVADFGDFSEEDFSYTSNVSMLGYEFQIRGNDLYLAIPEPSTYAAIFGLVALLFAIRRRKNK